MGGGGLMQLVASGAQDIYLTGNPQITFFKSVYKRYTSFAIEEIEQILNGTSTVTSNSFVGNNLTVKGNTTIAGNITVDGSYDLVDSDLSGLISENFQEIISTNSKTKLILEHYAGLGTTLMGRGKSKELKHKKEPAGNRRFLRIMKGRLSECFLGSFNNYCGNLVGITIRSRPAVFQAALPPTLNCRNRNTDGRSSI